MGNKTLSLLLLFPLLGCDCDGGGGLHQKKADIAVTPNPLLFDTVPRNTTASKLLHFENPGDFRLEVSSVSIESGEGFSIGGETAFTVEPGASHDLEVRFASGDLDTVDGTLLVQSNADKKEQTRVELKAMRRQGPVLVVCVESADIPLSLNCGSPGTIDFGKTRIDETRQATITLRSEGTDPVSVSSVSLSGAPALTIEPPTVPATLAVGEQLRVPVKFRPAVEDPAQGTVSIQSNDAVAPSAQVDLRGEGALIGLCIEPAVLDFGGVRVGTSKELPLKLSNCGTAPLDITNAEIYLGNGEFAVVDPIASPITLPAQAGFNFELKVRYSPADEGEDEGRMRITTSNGTALVPMSGDSNGCRLVVTPTSLSFNWDANTGGEQKNILIENTGSETCTVTNLEITEGWDKGYSWGGEVGPPRGGLGGGQPFWDLPHVIAPAESWTISVGFWPWQFDQETVTGKIELLAAERPDEIITIDMTATIDFTSVCDLTVSPTSLSFGVINVGQRRTLGVQLRGGEMAFAPCRLDSITLLDDSGGAFVIESNPPEVVFPEAVVFIDFVPTVSGVHQGTLEIVTDGDTPQTFTIPIAGGAGSSNLCVEPRDLPFGDRSTPGTLDFNISACGTDPVTVNALDWTSADTEFTILNPPALPFTLNASENRTITVQYNPADQGGDTGVLAVRSTDVLKPEIAVRATGGREIVPPEAGRFLYYWQILNQQTSDIVRQPLQGELTTEPYWGDRAGTGCAGCHQLSPDGKYLAVTSLGATRGINVIDVEANAIATGPGNYVEALFMSWNPDVNTNPPYQYVYSSNGDMHLASLYTGYIGPLTGADDPNVFETMPSWGPDGQIVYVRTDSGGIGFGGAGGLYLIDEAGGVPIPVVGASENNFANYYPRYSPNGMWIAYTLSQQAQSTISAPDAQLRMVKSDNSNMVLTLPNLNGGASSFPTWSVNGQFISFSSNRAGGQGSWDIYIAPINPETGEDGAAVNVAEANTAWFEHSAQWSP
jgi:hypothetical protein